MCWWTFKFEGTLLSYTGKSSCHLFLSSWAVDGALLCECGVSLSPCCEPLSRYSWESCHISHPPRLLPDSKAPAGEPFAGNICVAGSSRALILLNRKFFQFCEAPEQFKFHGEYFSPEASWVENAERNKVSCEYFPIFPGWSQPSAMLLHGWSVLGLRLPPPAASVSYERVGLGNVTQYDKSSYKPVASGAKTTPTLVREA